MNLAIVSGNLGADVELRYTQGQKAVANFNVATTHKSGDSEVTEWHRIVVWEKLAENCGKYLSKGKKVIVQGRLATRSWDDKQTGQKKYATEIVAHSVEFLSPMEKSAPYQQQQSHDVSGLENIPF